MNGTINNLDGGDPRRATEEKAIEHRREYTDPIKHYVRKNVWEPTAQARLQKIIHNREARRLRYFTLCAEQAIDIHYFHIQDLLTFEHGYFPDTVYCECHQEPYEVIASNLGKTTGFLSRFEDLILVTNSRESKSFYDLLPFDIFNLDFTGCCFPSSDPPFSDTIRAISALISTMGRIEPKKGFDILFTFRAHRSEENEDAITQLLYNQRHNIENYVAYRSAVEQKGLNFEVLVNDRYHEFLLYSLPKRIAKWGAEAGFYVGCPKSVFYPRPSLGRPEYYIISFVISFDPPVSPRRLRIVQPDLAIDDPQLAVNARYLDVITQTINDDKQNIAATRFNRDDLENEVTSLLAISRNP